MRPFDYYDAKSVEGALQLMSSLAGKRFRLLASDTDLIVQMKNEVDFPDAVIHIGEVEELRKIEDLGEMLRIGATVTFTAIAESSLINQYAPVLAEASREVGAWQIRNRATIGGNIVNASPAGDSIPPLYVLGATLSLRSEKGERRIAIEDFALGPGKTKIEYGEILVAVEFPKMKSTERGFFKKIGQRRAMAIAKASVAAALDLQHGKVSDARIALGAVAPTVIRAPKSEAVLRGKKLSAQTINEAAETAAKEARPIDDIRSTVEYRREMCRVLLRRGLEELLEASG